MNEGETVIAMAGGATGGNLGLLVATDRRALFISEGIVNHSFEDFPYDRITTVSSSRSMMTAKISIHTGGAARIVEQVYKGEAEMVAGIIRERVEAVTRERTALPIPSPPTSTAPVAAPSLAAQLRELAELRDQGILTPEEFDAQKARLLS